MLLEKFYPANDQISTAAAYRAKVLSDINTYKKLGHQARRQKRKALLEDRLTELKNTNLDVEDTLDNGTSLGA